MPTLSSVNQQTVFVIAINRLRLRIQSFEIQKWDSLLQDFQFLDIGLWQTLPPWINLHGSVNILQPLFWSPLRLLITSLHTCRVHKVDRHLATDWTQLFESLTRTVFTHSKAEWTRHVAYATHWIDIVSRGKWTAAYEYSCNAPGLFFRVYRWTECNNASINAA
jgi:hypothetical protein